MYHFYRRNYRGYGSCPLLRGCLPLVESITIEVSPYWALAISFYLRVDIELMLFITDTPKPADVEKAEVITDYDAKSPDELTIRIGESVEIVNKKLDSDGWWKVRIFNMVWYRVTNLINHAYLNCIVPG